MQMEMIVLFHISRNMRESYVCRTNGSVCLTKKIDYELNNKERKGRKYRFAPLQKSDLKTQRLEGGTIYVSCLFVQVFIVGKNRYGYKIQKALWQVINGWTDNETEDY